MVDITGGVGNIARGAALGIGVQQNRGNALASAYQGIGETAAGAVDKFAQGRKDAKHLNAIQNYANSIQADPSAVKSGDPQTILMAIGQRLKQMQSEGDQNFEMAKMNAQALINQTALGLRQTFEAEGPQREATAQLGMEEERAKRQRAADIEAGQGIAELAAPTGYGAYSPGVGGGAGGTIEPTQNDIMSRALAGGPNGRKYGKTELAGALGTVKEPTPKAPADPAETELKLAQAALARKQAEAGGFAPRTTSTTWKPQTREEQLAWIRDKDAAVQRNPRVPQTLKAKLDAARTAYGQALETAGIMASKKPEADAAFDRYMQVAAEVDAATGGGGDAGTGNLDDVAPEMPANPADATDEQLRAYQAWKARHPEK